MQTYDQLFHQAEVAIINDWVNEHVKFSEPLDGICRAYIELFIVIEGSGKTKYDAIVDLKLAIVGRASSKHNVCIDWLYSELNQILK